MKTLSKLQQAIRKNKQLAEWTSFRNSFENFTDCKLDENNLLDVEKSFAFTEGLMACIAAKRLNGRLRSNNELTQESSDALVQEFFREYGNPISILYLSNYELFEFFFDPITMSQRWTKILHFDGDTVYLVSSDFDKGIGIDYYKSELTSEWRYTVDFW